MISEDAQALIQALSSQQATMKEQCKKISLLIDEVKKLNKDNQKQEQFLLKDVAIAARDQYKTNTINNPGFNRCRIFVDAGFTPAHSSGISVDLLYNNSIVGEVLNVISSNGSAGKFSEPIDISYLSGFQFAITNRDSINSTTIKNFRVVMYNDKATSYILESV